MSFLIDLKFTIFRIDLKIWNRVKNMKSKKVVVFSECGLLLLVSLSAFYFLNSEENVRQKDQESTNEASNGKSNESNLSSTNTGQQNEETAENNEDESPCYGAAIDVFVNKGFQVVSIGVDEEGLKVDELEDKLQVHQPKLLYVNPTFQNPTGTCMPEKSRKQLVELAEMYHFLILEDDSFSEVSFDNITVPKPIKFFDKNGHVIYLKGFSKTTAPGIRIAAVIVDGVLFDWLYGTKATMDIGSPLLPQKALLPILRTERMKNHMEKLKIALELRRNTVLDAFKNLEEVMIYKPKGGLNAWIKLPSMIQPIKLQEAARKNKISYLPGSACFLHEPKQHYIRISYSYLSEHDLQVGIEKLVDILQNMMKEM